LVAPTRSSKPARNGSARASVLAGLLAALALPGTIAAAELTEELTLFDAAWAVPAAFVLGVTALAFARRARRRVERTLGRVGGRRSARTGRFLGAIGIAAAFAGAIALAFYWYLENVG
jgi:hypothetical protein